MASVGLFELLAWARADPILSGSARWEDANKLGDGVLTRAGEEMVELAARYYVPSDEEGDLERAVAEVTALDAYFTLGAQRKGKAVKVDFTYMHCLNASVFFHAFLRGGVMGRVDLKRLLEAKARLDLAIYVSRGCPELRAEEVEEYVPNKETRGMDWQAMWSRLCAFGDDGHASKLLRAVGNAGKCADGVGPLKGEETWKRAAMMVVDSIQSRGPTWIRNTGWEEGWKDVPARNRETEKEARHESL